MARRSAPPSRRWVANEWRSACGCTAPCAAAWRAQVRRRRRTSDVESRRPVLERNSAGSPVPASSAPAGALQVARHGAQRVLADRHEARLAALALDAHLLGVEVDRADVEVDDLLRAQAARVGELEQRAVALLERRRGRDPVQQRRDVGGLERARQALGQLRRGEQLGRVGLHQRRARRARGSRRAGRRACARPCAAPARARPSGRRSGAATGSRSPRARGRSGPPSGPAPRRRCGRARASPSAAPRRRRSWSSSSSAPRQAAGSSALPFGGMASFFIDTATGQVATLRQLVEAGVADAASRRRGRGIRSRARATRRRCGTR